MKSFKEFVQSYNEGTLHEDAAWRAYDIENHIVIADTERAMRRLGFTSRLGMIGYMALSAHFDIGSADRAKHLLGLWAAWTRINEGRRKHAKLREPQET